MPHFVFRGIDRPGTQELRMQLREAHRAYIRQPAPDCRTVLGGPLLSDPDQQMFGTLLVFEADDRGAVARFTAGDPYLRAGLFASTTIDLWSWGLGQPAKSDADHRL